MLTKRGGTRIVLGALAILVAGVFLAVFVLPRGGMPEEVGMERTELAPCPDTPNCVSSKATDEEHAIAPIAFEGDPAAAMDRMVSLLGETPRVKVVTATDRYIHAEFTTRIMRFVDDVELVLSPDEGVFHVRSASRIGKSDLGANRKRVEWLREAYGKG